MRRITPATIEAWRTAAKRNKPWAHSTGPKSAAGKAKVVANGKTRQKGRHSVRELLAFAKAVRDDLKAARTFVDEVYAQFELEERSQAGTTPARDHDG